MSKKYLYGFLTVIIIILIIITYRVSLDYRRRVSDVINISDLDTFDLIMCRYNPSRMNGSYLQNLRATGIALATRGIASHVAVIVKLDGIPFVYQVTDGIVYNELIGNYSRYITSLTRADDYIGRYKGDVYVQKYKGPPPNEKDVWDYIMANRDRELMPVWKLVDSKWRSVNPHRQLCYEFIIDFYNYFNLDGFDKTDIMGTQRQTQRHPEFFDDLHVVKNYFYSQM